MDLIGHNPHWYRLTQKPFLISIKFYISKNSILKKSLAL